MVEVPKLWKHQIDASEIGERIGYVGIFHSPGAGKGRTVFELLKKWKDPFPCLVLSVKEQLHVWTEEASKWMPSIQVINVGGVTRNKRIAGVSASTGLCVMNYESFRGIRSNCRERKFNTIVLDEAWKISSASAKITQAVLFYLREAQHRAVLSPWPARRCLEHVYAPIKFLDNGDRLGATFSSFRYRFMVPHPAGFGWLPRRGAEEEIGKLIQDICSVVRDEDIRPSLGVPASVQETVLLDMSDSQVTAYDQLLHDWSLSGYDVFGGGERHLRMLQVVAGQKFAEFDPTNPKTNYLIDLLCRLDDRERVVVFTWFRPETVGVADAVRTKSKRPVFIALGGMSESMGEILEKWRGNKGSVLVCQGGKTAGWHAHESRYCVFHSQPQSALQRYQAIRRLERPPQTRSVAVLDLIMNKTIEPHVQKALAEQKEFMDAVRDYAGGLRNAE